MSDHGSSSSEISTPSPAEEGEKGILEGFFTPGATRNPAWILALDVAFAALFMVFLGLLWLTGGNIHFWVLIGIECCLWASVKWSVVIIFIALVY